MKTIHLSIKATLEIDPSGAAQIKEWNLDELRGKTWDLRIVSANVSLKTGEFIPGTIHFVEPTPYDLKIAQLNTDEA